MTARFYTDSHVTDITHVDGDIYNVYVDGHPTSLWMDYVTTQILIKYGATVKFRLWMQTNRNMPRVLQVVAYQPLGGGELYKADLGYEFSFNFLTVGLAYAGGMIWFGTWIVGFLISLSGAIEFRDIGPWALALGIGVPGVVFVFKLCQLSEMRSFRSWGAGDVRTVRHFVTG